ncbi:MAG: 3-hydroxybutyryl-CoA dehydrogenase [Flavobacteriales bacterium]|nr:3-hydroxybutyryl-CoA dehydrogenase [Flavobacteriales bacterium]
MKKVSIIGSGTMGNGIAHCFAQKGFNVSIFDISKENLIKAESNISKNLDRMIKKEKISELEKKNILSRISFLNELEKNIEDSDLVVEAATERKDVKFNIFQKLDKLCKPETILATNTSSISITEIGSKTQREEKVIGMHFMNPVPIMKLVEVIKGKKTSDETFETIMDLSKLLDKKPVFVNDAPGFVANRILMPMINEAILTLEQNVSGVEEIDTVMILGMSHPMGPLFLADFIGLDVCLSILNVMHEGFQDDKYAACNLLKQMVNNNELGVKTGKGFYIYSEGLKNKKVSPNFLK